MLFMTDEIEFKAGGSNPAPKPKPLAEVDKEPTLLEELAEELAKKIERSEIEIPLPSRPGISLRFSPNITQYELRKWRRQSALGNKRDEIDSVKFACTVIGHTCTGIYVRGEQVIDDEGYPVTFGSPIIMKMTETELAVPDAIRAFFGVDPHIESAALAVLEAAGYGEELTTEENPTRMTTSSDLS